MTLPGTPWMRWATVLVVAGGAYLGWQALHGDTASSAIASGNGRIEAAEIDVATRNPGRITEILAKEGDFVTAGQVVARMDTSQLQAQRAEAEAQLQRAIIGVATANSVVTQRDAEQTAAAAVVAQREAERNATDQRLDRSEQLARTDAVSRQVLDDDRARRMGAVAAVAAAKAQLAATEAAINAARSQVVSAKAAITAAQAVVQRIDADIADCALKAPRDGRVQYRVAEPGEVLGAGGRLLNIVDLGDVYMTFFLPTAQAGRVALGAEARIVLDAAPQIAIPATISFVADVAQFTPKTVETASERGKLMFRVKARISPALLRKHIRQVKTGLPGVAYVKLDPNAAWPANLPPVLTQ